MESIRAITIGGSVFTEKMIKDLNECFPNAKILAAYGLTEADCVSTSIEEEGTVGLSSGYPFYNVQMKIIEDNGTALGPNQVGEIYFKTAIPFSGYFGDPDMYAECFDSDNFVKSGDLGYFDDAGRIYVIDRMKHMIKSVGSIKITPMEIEMVVNEIDGISHTAFVGVLDDKLFYDKIYAFVVKDKTRDDLTEEFVKNYVNEKVIDAKMISGGVHFIKKLPTTPSGKVLYKELKKMAMEIQARKKNLM